MAFFDEVLVFAANPGGLGLQVYIAGGAAGGSPIPVTLASGSGSSGGPSSSTTSVSGVFAYDSGSSTQLMASNTNRVGIGIYNDSNQNYLVAFSSTASLNSWDFVLVPQSYYENPDNFFWRGAVSGIGSGSGSGNIRVREFLP